VPFHPTETISENRYAIPLETFLPAIRPEARKAQSMRLQDLAVVRMRPIFETNSVHTVNIEGVVGEVHEVAGGVMRAEIVVGNPNETTEIGGTIEGLRENPFVTIEVATETDGRETSVGEDPLPLKGEVGLRTMVHATLEMHQHPMIWIARGGNQETCQYLPLHLLESRINLSLVDMAELEVVGAAVAEGLFTRIIIDNLVVVDLRSQVGIAELSLQLLLRLKSRHLVPRLIHHRPAQALYQLESLSQRHRVLMLRTEYVAGVSSLHP
jgi:hypothetical protein